MVVNDTMRMNVRWKTKTRSRESEQRHQAWLTLNIYTKPGVLRSDHNRLHQN